MTHSMLGVRRGHSVGGLIRQRRTLLKKIRLLSLLVRSQGAYIIALKGETMIPNKKNPPMTVVERLQADMATLQALCERYEQEDRELRTVLALEQERARLAGLELAQWIRPPAWSLWSLEMPLNTLMPKADVRSPGSTCTTAPCAS